jgi:hypothetical protein
VAGWEALRRTFPERVVELRNLYPHALVTFNIPENVSVRLRLAKLNLGAQGFRQEFPSTPEIDLLPRRNIGCDYIVYDRTTTGQQLILACHTKIPEQREQKQKTVAEALEQLETAIDYLKKKFPDALGSLSFCLPSSFSFVSFLPLFLSF